MLRRIKLYQGDCLEVIPRFIKPNTVSLVFCSPPYPTQRKTDYDCVTKKDFPNWMRRIMATIRPVLKPDANVFMVVNAPVVNGCVDDYVLRTELALREDGWIVPFEWFWHKTDSSFLGSHYRPRRSIERVLWFSPSRKPFIDLHAFGDMRDHLGYSGSHRLTKGPNPPYKNRKSKPVTGEIALSRIQNFFTAYVGKNNKDNSIHPARFPVMLAEQAILAFSRAGDLVMDPFVGSGSTGVAAQNEGRQFIGIDLELEYIQECEERLRVAAANFSPKKTYEGKVRLHRPWESLASPKMKSRKLESMGLCATDRKVMAYILSRTVLSSDESAGATITIREIVAGAKLKCNLTAIRSKQRLREEKLIDFDGANGRSHKVMIDRSLLRPLNQ